MNLDDPPRWVRMSVTWTPTPRPTPIDIGWTVNGISRYTFQATGPTWPTREIALHPGDLLVLHASQTTAGELIVALHEGGRLVGHKRIDEPGSVECVFEG